MDFYITLYLSHMTTRGALTEVHFLQGTSPLIYKDSPPTVSRLFALATFLSPSTPGTPRNGSGSPQIPKSPTQNLSRCAVYPGQLRAQKEVFRFTSILISIGSVYAASIQEACLQTLEITSLKRGDHTRGTSAQGKYMLSVYW